MIGKKHMADIIMTEEDYRSLKESREEKKKGKLITSEQLKEHLGI